MINYKNLTTEAALRLLKAYIAKQKETGEVHNELNQFIEKIESSLKTNTELPFKIPTKEQFREALTRFEAAKNKSNND